LLEQVFVVLQFMSKLTTTYGELKINRVVCQLDGRVLGKEEEGEQNKLQVEKTGRQMVKSDGAASKERERERVGQRKRAKARAKQREKPGSKERNRRRANK